MTSPQRNFFFYLKMTMIFIGLFILEQLPVTLLSMSVYLQGAFRQFFLFLGLASLFLIVFFLYRYLKGIGWLESWQLYLNKEKLFYIFKMFALLIVANIGISMVLNLFGLLKNQTTANQVGIESLFSAVPIWIMGLVLVILAPLVEETICRALIYHTFTNQRLAFILATFIFAFLHVFAFSWDLVVYLSVSAVLTYTYQKHHSLNESLAVHALNNLLGFWMIVLQMQR